MVNISSMPAFVFDDVLLVPQRTRARSRKDVLLSTRLTDKLSLALPIVSANTPWCTEALMAIEIARLGGLGIIHRMASVEAQVAEIQIVKSSPVGEIIEGVSTLDGNNRYLVGAAIGAKAEDIFRAEKLLEAGADLLALDIAHGHADYVIETVEAIKSRFNDVQIVVGNVATREGTRDLIEAGADAVKVGIGPGGICTTRLVTGAGVPQLSAILECAEEAKRSGVPIIADGGIRSSGDAVKALAAGASAMMLGSLLAGTDESATRLVWHEGKPFKTTTGFVSLGVSLTRKRLSGSVLSAKEIKDYVAEGVEATFPYTGPLRDHIRQIVGGIQSGLSYSGAMTLEELVDKARFVTLTSAGRAENKPHSVERAPQLHPDFRGEFLAAASED